MFEKIKVNVLFGILLFVVFFLQADLLSAQAIPKEVCLFCHGAEGLEKAQNGKTVSLYVDGGRFSRSVHGGLGCAACHSDISRVLHASQLRPVQCSACHAAASQVYEQSVHGQIGIVSAGPL